MIQLIEPDIKYKIQYTEMMDEWINEGGKIAPWVLQLPYKTDEEFSSMLVKVDNASKGIDIGDYAACTTYWVYDKEKDTLIGATNIRHYLTEIGLKTWGHIGYGVRPTERKKGYATQILALALQKCRKMGLQKVLLGCYSDNIGSSRVIKNNGGVIENSVIEEETGKLIERYWIDL